MISFGQDLTLIPTKHSYESICGKGHSLDLGIASDLANMCEVVTHSDLCEGVPRENLLKCDSLLDEGHTEFDLWGLTKGCAQGVLNSLKDLLSFMWDILTWVWDNTTSNETRSETSKVAKEYAHGAKLYLHSTYEKAYTSSAPPMRTLKAVKKMEAAIGSMVLKSITNMITSEYREFGCLNFQAKSALLCKVVGDIFIPPAAVVGLLKYGKGAFKMYPKMGKTFKALNNSPSGELKLLPAPAKQLPAPATPRPNKTPAKKDIVVRPTSSGPEEDLAKGHRMIGPLNKNLKGASGTKYKSIPMNEKYIGESLRPVQSFKTKVRYFTKDEAERYKVFVDDKGKIVDFNGEPFETPSFMGSRPSIYVMDDTGNIYIYPEHIVGKLHHSSFLAGRKVAAAGEVETYEGFLLGINDRSGHYRPDKEHYRQVLEELKTRGADFSETPYVNWHD